MTQDRLMPRLLPGILELSQTARYFAFHTFLLDEYRRRKLPPNAAGLSQFIKGCEWDPGPRGAAVSARLRIEPGGSAPVARRRRRHHHHHPSRRVDRDSTRRLRGLLRWRFRGRPSGGPRGSRPTCGSSGGMKTRLSRSSCMSGGIDDPLHDVRVPRLLDAVLRYRRCSGVAVYSSRQSAATGWRHIPGASNDWRLIHVQGEPISYVPNRSDDLIESLVSIDDDGLRRLSAAGMSLDAIFPRRRIPRSDCGSPQRSMSGLRVSPCCGNRDIEFSLGVSSLLCVDRRCEKWGLPMSNVGSSTPAGRSATTPWCCSPARPAARVRTDQPHPRRHPPRCRCARPLPRQARAAKTAPTPLTRQTFRPAVFHPSGPPALPLRGRTPRPANTPLTPPRAARPSRPRPSPHTHCGTRPR